MKKESSNPKKSRLISIAVVGGLLIVGCGLVILCGSPDHNSNQNQPPTEETTKPKDATKSDVKSDSEHKASSVPVDSAKTQKQAEINTANPKTEPAATQKSDSGDASANAATSNSNFSKMNDGQLLETADQMAEASALSKAKLLATLKANGASDVQANKAVNSLPEETYQNACNETAKSLMKDSHLSKDDALNRLVGSDLQFTNDEATKAIAKLN